MSRRAGSVQLEPAEGVMDYSVKEPSSGVKHGVGDDRAIEYGFERRQKEDVGCWSTGTGFNRV